MYQPTSFETEMEIRRLCADFIGGAWSKARAKDVTIERLGGFVNRNFAVTLKLDAINTEEQNDAPVKVMVHLYGNELIDSETGFKLNGEAAEALIVNQLAKRGLTPNILGVFPGGRIETFIPGRILALNDLDSPEIMHEMGQKLARIHSLIVPIRKTPDRLEILLRNVQNRSVLVKFENASEAQKVHYYKFLNFPLEKEMRQISELLSNIGGMPVFCHGDLSLNNIILSDDVTTVKPKMVFVDFELSSYYYRGFDFAYFFESLEFAAKRAPLDQPSFIKFDDKKVEELEELMIKSYLTECRLLQTNTDKTIGMSQNNIVGHIKMEMNIAGLAWKLVTVCNMHLRKTVITNPLAFEAFCEFLDQYYKQKEEVSDKYKDQISCSD